MPVYPHTSYEHHALSCHTQWSEMLDMQKRTSELCTSTTCFLILPPAQCRGITLIAHFWQCNIVKNGILNWNNLERWPTCSPEGFTLITHSDTRGGIHVFVTSYPRNHTVLKLWVGVSRHEKCMAISSPLCLQKSDLFSWNDLHKREKKLLISNLKPYMRT